MTFDELPLYQAVHRVYTSVEKPGSDDWISNSAKTAYRLVLMQIVESGDWTEQGIPYSMERVVEVWRDLRKNLNNRLKCEVSLTHGSRCFYANRGLGPCSDELDLDRIIPETRGGRYTLQNYIIVCSTHNQARGDRTIKDFLAASARPTTSAPPAAT